MWEFLVVLYLKCANIAANTPKPSFHFIIGLKKHGQNYVVDVRSFNIRVVIKFDQ